MFPSAICFGLKIWGFGAELSGEDRRCLEEEATVTSLMEDSLKEEGNNGRGSSEMAGSLRRRGKIQEESPIPLFILREVIV